MNHWTTARSVGFMNAGIADPELRKKKLNAECFGIAGGCWGSFVTFLESCGFSVNKTGYLVCIGDLLLAVSMRMVFPVRGIPS